jgi:putative phosphoesterase
MIKILVVSDIHYPDRRETLPGLSEYAKESNLIFALGDFTTAKALKYLKSFGKQVVAVHGNMDEPALKKSLPKTHVVKIEGLKIGLFHGNGGPPGIEARVRSAFQKELNAYIFGHSHKAINKIINGALYFNPGALCGRVQTIGFLYIDFKNIWGKIIKIDKNLLPFDK